MGIITVPTSQIDGMHTVMNVKGLTCRVLLLLILDIIDILALILYSKRASLESYTNKSHIK